MSARSVHMLLYFDGILIDQETLDMIYGNLDYHFFVCIVHAHNNI